MIGLRLASARDTADWHWRVARAAAFCSLALATVATNAGTAFARPRLTSLVGLAPRHSAPFDTLSAQASVDGGAQHFTFGYESLITQFLADVSTASGALTNTYAVTAQYGGAPTPNTGRRYQVSFSSNDVFNVSDPYPPDQAHGNGAGCLAPNTTRGSSDPPYTWCLTDAQLQQQVASVIAAHALPSDLSAVYFVFLPPGVDVCASSGAERARGANRCADTDFCGYHANFAGGGPVYAVLPYAGVSGCESGQAPNGEPAGDSEVSLLSHEHNDAITDPLLGGAGVGAWYEDANHAEVSDKCAEPNVYGAVFPGTNYNQVIGAHDYYLQDEFANADGADTSFDGCEQRPGAPNDRVSASADASPLKYHGGPVVGAHTAYAIFWDPQALSFTPSSSRPHLGQPVTFAAALPNAPGGVTYSWNFGDGSTTSAPVATVTHVFSTPGEHDVTLAAAGQAVAQPLYVLHNPAISFTHPKAPVRPGRRLFLDATSSTDPDGTITSWQWSFGDGTGSHGRSVTHAYVVAGSYTVTLTALDSNGSSGSGSARIVVRARPKRVAARLIRSGPASLVLARGHLLLRTGRSLLCTARAAACKVSAVVLIRAAARLRSIGGAAYTIHSHRAVRLVFELNRAARHLLHAARQVSVTFRIAARARRAAALNSRLSLELRVPVGV
jgi:chitodextrinase